MDHGRECYHCKQWVADGEPHDCWSTTETALTRDLHDDLQDAYDRLRETAVELGEQRIYASHHSIMFARRVCYCFVRPRHSCLEVCVFLGREVKGPIVRRATRVSGPRSRICCASRTATRSRPRSPTGYARPTSLRGSAGGLDRRRYASARRATGPTVPPRKRAKKR